MKKLYIIFALTFLSSCAVSNPPSGPGVFYTNVKELMFFNPNSAEAIETKICSKNYLGLVTFGNSNLSAIQAKSGITDIYSIERTYRSIFFTYAESCLIVKGKNI